MFITFGLPIGRMALFDILDRDMKNNLNLSIYQHVLTAKFDSVSIDSDLKVRTK